MTIALQFILVCKVSRVNVVFTDYIYPLSSTLRTHVHSFIQPIITTSFAIQHHTPLFTQVSSSFIHAFLGRRYL